MKYIGKCVVLCLLIGCSNDHKSKLENIRNQLVKVGFDFYYWQTDSLGCNAIKKRNFADILIKQDLLKHCTQEDIVDLLGKPHSIKRINEYILIYYLIDGHQTCENLKHKKKLVYNEAASFVITFDKRGNFIGTRFIYP